MFISSSLLIKNENYLSFVIYFFSSSRREAIKGSNLSVRVMFGGPDKDRTCDLFAASEALSQLSYRPSLYNLYSREKLPFLQADPNTSLIDLLTHLAFFFLPTQILH